MSNGTENEIATVIDHLGAAHAQCGTREPGMPCAGKKKRGGKLQVPDTKEPEVYWVPLAKEPGAEPEAETKPENEQQAGRAARA